MEKVVKITVIGRISKRRRRIKNRLKEFKLENLILIKRNGKYWIKINDRLFRVFFDDNYVIDQFINGYWEIESFKIIKNRKKLKIKIYLKRNIKIKDNDSKNVSRVNENKVKLNEKINHEKGLINYKCAKKLVTFPKNTPSLENTIDLNNIPVVKYHSRGINLKPILIGFTLILALIAIAMIYHGSFNVTTITIEKKLDVSVNLNDVIIYAPGMGTKDLGYVHVTVYGDSTDYRLILQLANLEVPRGCRIIAIQVWDGNELEGILTPITPSLVIDEYSSTSKTYKLKVFYITMRPCSLKIIIQASVELL